MSNSVIDLSPKIPICAPAEELWAILRDAPRPAKLAEYLPSWLDVDLSAAQLPKSVELRLRVFGNVLLDLTSQGWLFGGEGELDVDSEVVLRATPPDTVHRVNASDKRPAPAEVKSTLRRALVASRDEQLRDPSVRAFVRRMEQPRLYRGHRVSVRSLLTSPSQLAADIRVAMAAPETKHAELLAGLIQPYLQLASELPDEHTGLRLLDIWRYCRYTWSLPLQTQPGRRMFYLVRDAARPFHPIIGIAALGSAVVQISVRDHAIGWTIDSLKDNDLPPDASLEAKQKEQAKRLERPTRLAALHRELERAVKEIYRADLVEEGILTDSDFLNPTPEALIKLAQAADQDYRGSRERRAQTDNLEAEARSPMFRKKRVQVLGEILSARLEFNKYAHLDLEQQFQKLISYAEGKRALRMALRSVKKRHVAASLMEITTCGAVPPYGELLGGKLVAMLMASPQVIKDYRDRYDHLQSVIASRMRGNELVRDANLVLLGTTSLYHVGSSQYNRVNFPGLHGKIEYQLLGKTEGYGSVHLSQKTYAAVQELLREEENTQSYTFAAGVNYKLRSMSAALGKLGLQKLQKHATPRLVYALATAQNWKEYLTGQESEPRWQFNDIDNPAIETQQIIDYWKTRWFVKRAQRPETLAHLQADFRHPSLLHTPKPDSTSFYTEPVLFFLGPDKSPMISWNVFAEFDNGRISFAEKQSVEEASTIHIESTKLEDGIIQLLAEGRRVYLTGNPGDGKTHLLRRLEGKETWPAGTYTEPDASATPEDQLITGLSEAEEAGRPALIAINEGPLRHILSRLPDREELTAQLGRPFCYDKSIIRPTPKAVLIQLGSRQVLNKNLLSGALYLVQNRVDYTGAPIQILANVRALSQVRVRERLMLLLDQVRRGGIHVTVHQVLGMLARMITGGRSGGDQELQPYYDNLFASLPDSSPLATALAELDPAILPHAHLDTHLLWDAPSTAGPWLPGSRPVCEAPGEITQPPLPLEEAISRFRRLKRQHFFEAEHGDQVLASLPDDRRTFNELLSGPTAATVSRLLKALVRFAGQIPDPVLTLPLWTSLRYDSDSPAWARVAGASLREVDCAVHRPSLPAPVDQLLDYDPDHIVLALHAFPAPEGPELVVDLPLWRALRGVARGLPTGSRDEDAGRRVDNFLAAAAAVVSVTTEHLRIYNSKDNRETTVRVVTNSDAPNGVSYFLSN